MAAAVCFVQAKARVVIHTREKTTLVFGFLWAALLYPPALTVALAGLGHSARALQCYRRRHSPTQALEKLFQGCKGPISAAKKQVKPGGQKHACLRSIRQVPVYLNTDLEIYLQKDMVGTSPCSLSITAYGQLPQWWKVGLRWEVLMNPRAEFGSEVCKVPDWYLPTSDTLFMQNNEHRVQRHCHCWKCCVNHGAVRSCIEWQRM